MLLFQFLFQWLILQIVNGQSQVPYGLPLLYPYGRCTQEMDTQTMNLYITPALLDSHKPIFATVRPRRLDTMIVASPKDLSMIPVTNFTNVPMLQADSEATCYSQCLKYYCGENISKSEACSTDNYIKSLSSLSLHTLSDNPQVMLSIVQREPRFVRVFPLIPPTAKSESTYTYYTLYGSNVLKSDFTVPTTCIMQISRSNKANITFNGAPKAYKNGQLLTEKGDWKPRKLWDVVWLEYTNLRVSSYSLTKITSTKPLAVYTGMARKNNTKFSYVVQHTHQMPDSRQWGKTFIVDLSHLEMLASEHDVVVSLNILALNSSTVNLTIYPDQNIQTFELEAEIVRVVTIEKTIQNLWILQGSNKLLILYEVYKMTSNGNLTHFSLILQPTEWFTFKQTAVLATPLEATTPVYHITIVTAKYSTVEVQDKNLETAVNIMDYKSFTDIRTVDIGSYSVHQITVHNLSMEHAGGGKKPDCYDSPEETPGINMLIFTSKDTNGCHNRRLGVTVFAYSPQASYASTNPPVLNDSSTQNTSEVCKKSVDKATIAVIVSVSVVTFLLVVILVAITAIIVALMKPRILFQKPDPPPKDFDYDIFLSFADHDKALVEEILYTPLTKCGYKVFWHLSDFIAGLTIAENMLTAVRQSRWVIFACSEHFENSEFCQQELRFGLNNHYSTYKGKYRRVIPLVLQEGSCPQKLKQLYPIKFIVKKNHRLKKTEVKDLMKKLNFGKPLAVLKDIANNMAAKEDRIHLLSVDNLSVDTEL